MTNEDVKLLAVAKGITRLCHFTPVVNLLHIASGKGLMSTLELSADHRAVFVSCAAIFDVSATHERQGSGYRIYEVSRRIVPAARRSAGPAPDR